MALAILRYLEESGGHLVLEADTGTNTYYQFKAGKTKRKYKGLELVDDVVHTSPLLKAPSSGTGNLVTRFELRIPADVIGKDGRYIQLHSFSTKSRISPAISEVVTVQPKLSDYDDLKLPTIMALSQSNGHPAKVQVQQGPCDVRENKIVEAMFFDKLLGALPGLLTGILPKLQGFLAPGTDGNAAPQENENGGQPASSPVLQAILQIIQKLAEKHETTPAKAETKSISHFSHDFSINPQTLLKLAPLLEKLLSPETIKAIGDNPVKLFKAVSDSALKFQKMELDHLEKINPGLDDKGLDAVAKSMSRRRVHRFSEAKIAPALLAALPALMPVLEKVLSPDMIKAIGDQPVKLFNAIAEAGLKHTQQELNHLEKINPGVDDPAFDAIVNSMSVKSAVSVKSTFSRNYTIEFLQTHTLPIAGKDRIVYDIRQKMHIPVSIVSSGKKNGTASIAKSIFQLIIQDGDTMEVLLEKKFKVKDLVPGKPVHEVALDSTELKKLPLHRDLKVELTFNWRESGKVLGTFKNHYIWLSAGYLFQRTGGAASLHFALNDVARFRNFWHKVWEGGPVTHDRWAIDFECRYYYGVNSNDATIKQQETRKMTVSDSSKIPDADAYRRKISAKLKSGMDVSLAAYNELLAMHQLPPLTEAQLSAFTGQAFLREGSTSARVSVNFKGRKGETAALWTYPEGNMQTYVLGKASGVDPSGMISEVLEEEVQFPRLSSIHFVGTKSQ